MYLHTDKKGGNDDNYDENDANDGAHDESHDDDNDHNDDYDDSDDNDEHHIKTIKVISESDGYPFSQISTSICASLVAIRIGYNPVRCNLGKSK